MTNVLTVPMWRLIKMLTVLSVLVSAYIGLTSWLNNAETFAIQFVRIEGELKNVSRDNIHNATSSLVNTGFFAADTRAITEKIESLPWIKTVRVSRVWPDTLSLNIVEETPVAKWNEQFLLNEQGDIIRPDTSRFKASLPQLGGDDARSRELYSAFKDINQSLKKMGISVIELSETSYGSWSAKLANGMWIELGKTEPVKKLITGIRLLAMSDEDILSQIKSLDMRYPNGMSVTWKEGGRLIMNGSSNTEMQRIKS